MKAGQIFCSKLSCLCVFALIFGFAGLSNAEEPLRTASGEAVRAIYYFPHWWQPWLSDEDLIAQDFKRLRAMGINTLLLDHEWTQGVNQDNWNLLDRAHRLAAGAGLRIVPWLSLKTWSDMGLTQGRVEQARKQFGVDLAKSQNQDGSTSSLVVYDEATIIAGSGYAIQYLDRYKEKGVIAEFDWNGKVRPTVALTVELAWDGGGFDARSIDIFRRWLEGRYKGKIAVLNKLWKTRYGGFAEVDPLDRAIFDYANHAKARTTKHPQAVEDHIEFRSVMVNRGLQAMKERVKLAHPDVLISSEFPYQLSAEHPHAKEFRVVFGSNPTCADHVEILFLRMTGLMTESEKKALRAHQDRTGQKVILCYRTYNHWGERHPASNYADQAAELANGIGFYSWNEMVDVHLVVSDPRLEKNQFTLEADVAQRMQKHVAEILKLSKAKTDTNR